MVIIVQNKYLQEKKGKNAGNEGSKTKHMRIVTNYIVWKQLKSYKIFAKL